MQENMKVFQAGMIPPWIDSVRGFTEFQIRDYLRFSRMEENQAGLFIMKTAYHPRANTCCHGEAVFGVFLAVQ